MESLAWGKPTVIFYRERVKRAETEPLAVVKARRISLEAVKDGGFKGALTDFFTLMGDVDYISTAKGKKDRYVLCWFDDREDDFSRAFRKLNGVTFPGGASYTTSEGKRTYNASFHAQAGKLQ